MLQVSLGIAQGSFYFSVRGLAVLCSNMSDWDQNSFSLTQEQAASVEKHSGAHCLQGFQFSPLGGWRSGWRSLFHLLIHHPALTPHPGLQAASPWAACTLCDDSTGEECLAVPAVFSRTSKLLILRHQRTVPWAPIGQSSSLFKLSILRTWNLLP